MLTIATAALLGALVCTPSAWGAWQGLADGQTRLELSRGLHSVLRQEGVALKPLGPAKLNGRNLTLPLTSGAVDHDVDKATFVQSGGLRLVSGRKAVALRQLKLHASSKSLSAIVAGKRMRLARLGGVELDRNGFDARLEVKRLLLTGRAAAALNRVLDLAKVLRPGRSLGSVNGLGEPSTVPISFGSFSMGGPDTVFSKLELLGGQMGIWGASERWGAPGETYFLFTIQPTAVPPDASAGLLEGEPSDGVSMEIHAPPSRNMLLLGPRIDLAAKELSAHLGSLPTISGLIQRQIYSPTPIATLDYSAAQFQIRPKVGAFELMGIRAVANQFIADQLNSRFATSTFQAGETLAKITVTLHSPVSD